MAGEITSLDELRALFPTPGERTLKKQLAKLDRHCRRFIELAPFLVIATGNGESFDASPRGGAPGFVQVLDDSTLWIPDSPGNNRLDSLANIVTTGRAGLLFLIPGVNETLRVNGTARVTTDPEKLQRFASEVRTPRVVIDVTVEEAYLHCAKALMRSKLWSDEARIERTALPSMGQMLADQIGTAGPIETQEQMVARYTPNL